jgi:hypothetical protein
MGSQLALWNSSTQTATSSTVLLPAWSTAFCFHPIHELTLPPPQPYVTFRLLSREKCARKPSLAPRGYRRIVVDEVFCSAHQIGVITLPKQRHSLDDVKYVYFYFLL